jgi:uncharacterized protein (TIGR04206 family)
MALVRSEYAGEFAVVAAWISALMPWSITYFRPAEVPLELVVVRYGYFHLQFLLSGPLLDTETFLLLHEAHGYVASNVRPAITVAAVAAVGLTLALALSVAYYHAEARIESLPVDPVRLMGALLGVCGLVYLGATALLWQEKAGTTVPVAPLFMLVFAVSLLRVERD